ncbi:DUF6998 domain-containing protein [Gymnodinialimonas ceratoperidinii]|uniref:DUF6998 domain-containing protein n=1 Tax=Gymnodinialimonas ceratoperidinii TaxID=2856823 RepID=A0A8F6TWW3_9RHOB|nr:hypothetical protein [Gymnodinialimonas ceratoperidinii]QXT39419.1 hypothetical protein KYE46_16070 [Gymnodinialimonas ceratoperidinii]
MNETDWPTVGTLIDELYHATDALEKMFPGRKFTLDGHLVGSVGEVVASFMFDLELNPASTLGHDARAKDGRKVEIKLTQGKSVGLRHESEHLIVLSRPKGRSISVIYNGPGALAWNAAGKMQKNGQRSLGLQKLRMMAANLGLEQQLPLVRVAPV